MCAVCFVQIYFCMRQEKLKVVLKERVQKLAQSLKDRINLYVLGDKEGFVQKNLSEAQRLNRTAEDPAQLFATLFGKAPAEVSMGTMKDSLAMLFEKDPAEILAMLFGKDPAEVPMGKMKDRSAKVLAMLFGKDPAEASIGTMLKDPAEVLAMLLGNDPVEVLAILFGKAQAEVIMGTMKDPAEAFAMLFGIELFEEYVGQLGMPSMVTCFSSTDSMEVQKEKLNAAQTERDEKLAQILKNRLSQYVQGDKEGFVQQAKSEVQRLSAGSGSYGGNLLQIIGSIYERQVAKEAGGSSAVLHVNQLRITAATAACELIQLLLDLGRQLRTAQNYSDYYSQLKAFLQSNKELLIRSLWKLNVLDIEVTLLHVCQMVLQDSNADEEDLRARAMGLETLGKIFQTAKPQIEDGILGGDTDADTDNALLQLWNDIAELCRSVQVRKSLRS